MTQDKSLGELFGDLTRELGDLVRKEVQLARVEMTEKLGAAVKGAALLVVAGVLALGAFGALIIAAIFALMLTFSPTIAALIVSVVLLVVAGILGFIGLGNLKKGANPVPTETVETLKEDVQWARNKVS